MARTCAQNGTEKDSQEGLKMESPRQKETGKAKMTLRKTFEGDLKKMELRCGTAESEAKDRISWRKGNGCFILNGKRQQKKNSSTFFNIVFNKDDKI